MAFALLITGIVILIAAARGSQDQLLGLLKGDFTGQSNFLYWVIAILLIGFVGYIPKLKGLSVAFLTLVILVLFLKKGDSNGIGGGFFQQFASQIGATQTPVAATTSTNPSGAANSSLFSLPDFSKSFQSFNGIV